jgi:hypothetical protein
MRLPSVLSSLDLPLPELQAARLDGELFSVDECFSPIDEIERREHRARALALQLSPRLIAEQRTAAWVYGARDTPPSIHELCARIEARIRPSSLLRLALREVVIEDCDLTTIGDLQLTTPARTVVDLARFRPTFDDADRTTVSRLMSIGRFGIAECIAILNRRRNLPGKRAALERIRASCNCDQPPVTR